MQRDPARAVEPPGMQAAPLPPDETARLAALRSLALLDSPPAEIYDRITRLAARTLGVPIALMCLVDQSRQWFKSRIGIDAVQTSREVSFCAHTVFERRPLLVADTTLDRRFAGNPLVTAGPMIRAYMGVPLHSSGGHCIGTLCVADTRPREFSPEELATLAGFAGIIEEAMYATAPAPAPAPAAAPAVITTGSLESEAVYRDTFELAAVGIMHTSPGGQILRANPRACEMLGYAAEELRGLSFVDITHPDDVARNAVLFGQMASGRLDHYRFEKRYRRRDGEYLWADLSASLRRTASGDPLYMIGVLKDISEKKQTEADLTRMRDSLEAAIALQTQQLQERNEALRIQFKQMLESEQELRQSKQRLFAIANAVPAMIGYWNRELRCEFANEAYREWFGLAPEQIIGLTMPELLGESMFRLSETYAQRALAGQAQRFERPMPKSDGSISITEARYVPDIDEAGDVRGFYAMVTDVTAMRQALMELESAHARLLQESVVDFLTGLSNRRVFSERSEEAARRYAADGTPYGLILMDLDDFKHINDHFGHDIGDEVLRALGRTLREQLRGREDIVARLGGEEFAVLCFGDLDEDGLCHLAERIRGQIDKEGVQSARGIVRFTSSFGVALSAPEDASWRNIYARADAALYEAKASGKNRIIFGRSNARGASARFRSLSS